MNLKSIVKAVFLVSLLTVFTAGCSIISGNNSKCTLDIAGPKYECWGGLSFKGEKCLLHWREKGSSKEWTTKDRYYRYKRKVRDVKLEYSCIQKMPEDKSAKTPEKPKVKSKEKSKP